MTEATGQAFYAPPTWGQRIRWKLGYTWRPYLEFDEDPEGCHHWAKTVVMVKISFVDRLRLLLTGAMQIDIEHRTNTPIDKIESRSRVCLIGPGDERLTNNKGNEGEAIRESAN